MCLEHHNIEIKGTKSVVGITVNVVLTFLSLCLSVDV